ncbi:MAG: helix-turn-helix transcriptional regulator [Oscillospiraceae bacterium]|jgi:transcriptional regulator with XRE-family HTH domain|nr:helix-turn-helix transcriptional regulator [Oscillospiraceae bacterium]
MFAERIRGLRKENGETQQSMADRVGVSQKTVGSWETGDRLPSLDALSKIADAYCVTTDYLLGRAESTQFYKHSIGIINGEDIIKVTTSPDPPTDEEKARSIAQLKRKAALDIDRSKPKRFPKTIDELKALIEQTLDERERNL